MRHEKKVKIDKNEPRRNVQHLENMNTHMTTLIETYYSEYVRPYKCSERPHEIFVRHLKMCEAAMETYNDSLDDKDLQKYNLLANMHRELSPKRIAMMIMCE